MAGIDGDCRLAPVAPGAGRVDRHSPAPRVAKRAALRASGGGAEFAGHPASVCSGGGVGPWCAAACCPAPSRRLTSAEFFGAEGRSDDIVRPCRSAGHEARRAGAGQYSGRVPVGGICQRGGCCRCRRRAVSRWIAPLSFESGIPGPALQTLPGAGVGLGVDGNGGDSPRHRRRRPAVSRPGAAVEWLRGTRSGGTEHDRGGCPPCSHARRIAWQSFQRGIAGDFRSGGGIAGGRLSMLLS